MTERAKRRRVSARLYRWFLLREMARHAGSSAIQSFHLDLEVVLLHTCYWATVWTVVSYGRCPLLSARQSL